MHKLLPFLFLFSFTLCAHGQQWNWATAGGGTSNDDHCYAIATDSQGNVYYAGTTRGSNGQFACGPVGVGATTAGVLVKYGPDGVCQWLRTITVPSFDARAYAIAIDAQDRIYLTGSYRGTATFSDGISLASFNGTSIFLARYDTDGTCLWARRAGGNFATSEARGIALSEEGSIFITGSAGGDPVRVDNLQLPNPGEQVQVLVARFDSTGTALWGRISTGSNGTKSSRGISIQGDRLFVAGKAAFASAAYDGLPLTASSTTGNLFVLACDLQGHGLWARAYTGLADVEATGIAADSLGNLFVAGSLWGSLHLPDDTLQSMSANDDILLLGLDQEGQHRWGHSGGSAGRDLAWAVTADGMGNAYVAMQFEQSMDLLGQPFTALGGEDALIMKLRADGSPVWASRPSGPQRDIALCIHRQAQAPHRLFFGGYFWGTITYGGSTINDVQNGDGMLVSGLDTTFAVNVHSTPACPGDCNGSRTVFLNGAAPFTVAWSDGNDGTLLTGQCAGGLSVQVTDAQGQVISLDAPVAEAADPGLTVQQSNDSLWIAGGTGWQWQLNGSSLPGPELPYHIAQVSGAYHAVYTDAFGCAWSSDTLHVVLSVGQAERGAQAAWAPYPNPASDRLWLRDAPAILSAQAWDLAGRASPLVAAPDGSLSIDHWAPGLWQVELRFADGSLGRFRVVKIAE